MLRTKPLVVTKPSWLLFIVSVTKPIVSAELASLLAWAKSTFNLLP